jgi:SpoVK/Ycf46/Vps4 family AAA+-type ATPase
VLSFRRVSETDAHYYCATITRGEDNPMRGSRFSVHIADLFKARFPFLYVSTWEEERALAAIRSVAVNEALIKTARTVFTWSSTTGMVGGGQPERVETRAPLKALEIIERFQGPAVFVLKDFHVYFGGQGRAPEFQVIRKIRDLIPVLKQSPRPKNVVFLSPSLVLPHDLQKDVTIVDFDLPSLEEIKGVLREMISANRKSGRIVMDLNADEEERLANAALGLTLQEAENAFARAMVHDGRLHVSDLEVILEEKRQIIKKTEILEFIKSDLNMDDIGGLENLKRWLEKRNNSWLESARRYGLPAPKGVLITGVPGCGKSLTAKCMSSMWQLPLLRLDVGKIFSAYVGSSEENMRTAIKTAEAISPSILWIDEIEKGFSESLSSSDSGTSSRVFGTFLTWMQEKRSPVFVIATANNIHSLPPELLRKGRFDEIFFADLPTLKERIEIFRLHMERRFEDPDVVGEFKLTGEVLEMLADISEGFTGAEIEQAVISGLFEAFAESRSIRLDDFVKAVENTVPLSVTQAEQIRSIRDWANIRAVAATRQVDRAEYIKEVGEGAEDDVRTSRGGRRVDF